MSGIAEVLLNLGYEVSGSDLRSSPITERLEKLGARIHEGHNASNIGEARVVVISSAVNEKNPEVQEARRRQIPVIPRGEMLAELMRLKFGIAVAGSHGKTTVTSMTAAILSHAGLDPTVVVGGRVGTMGGSNARMGGSDFLVVESDESDGSFLKLAPILAVVTNIDHEHLDHYGSFDAIVKAFTDFANKIPFYGAVILCLDNVNIQQMLPSIERRTITYGVSAQAELAITGIDPGVTATGFSLRFRGRDLGEFRLNIPGVHNVLNATAAIAIALELEVTPEKIREGLAAYEGVDRRFQIKGKQGGVTVVDDYGHHPTEIRSTLATARQCGYKRILVLFQPHRYSRTQMLMDEFGGAFHQADAVFVTDIYAASETPIAGVTSAELAERIRKFGHRSVSYNGSLESGIEAIVGEAMEGDVIVTLGAGNVSQAGESLLRKLKEKL